MLDSKATRLAYDAMPTGLSVDELTAYYSSFHTVGLAGQCQLLSRRIDTLKSLGEFRTDEQNRLLTDARRRLRIARSVLAKRQLTLF